MHTASTDYLVSKFLYIRMLLAPEEWEEFLATWAGWRFFSTGRVLEGEGDALSCEALLQEYKKYFSSLECREEDSILPKLLTVTDNALYRQELGEGRFLRKPCRPLVQVSEHRFVVTSDGRVEPMVYGAKTVRFGMQFSFPTLFLEEGKAHAVLTEKKYENGELFRLLQRWVREHTEPAAFRIRGKKCITPLRIGKRCKRRGFYDLTREGAELL